MYQNPFNENMSSLEAQTVFFSMGDKTTDKREREQIKADYAKVLRVIMARELQENQYVLTSEPV